MYPPGTVEEFGIVAVNIAADGRAVENPRLAIKEGGKKTSQESKYSRFLIPGKKEFTPGCYRRPCGQLLAYGSCSYGVTNAGSDIPERCQAHPPHVLIIMLQQGLLVVTLREEFLIGSRK